MGALFLAVGRGAQPGAQLGELHSLDVAPTILRLLGLEVPDTMQGRPIASLLPGTTATATAALGLLRSGDHVIGQRSMYGGVTKMLLDFLPGLGIDSTAVDQTDLAAFEKALRPETKLLLLETPSNPTLAITDLAAVAEWARELGILTIVDNTAVIIGPATSCDASRMVCSRCRFPPGRPAVSQSARCR